MNRCTSGLRSLIDADAVGVADGVRDGLVPHHPPVDEHVLRPARSGPVSASAATSRRIVTSPVCRSTGTRSVAVAVDLEEAVAQRSRPADTAGACGPALVSEKPDVAVAQRHLRDDARDLRRSRPRPTSGTCAARAGCRTGRATSIDVPSGAPTSRTDARRAAVDRTSAPDVPSRGPRPQREVRHRRDRRQRFAAETQRRDPPQVVRRADLARRVPFDRQRASSASIPSPSSSTRIRRLPPMLHRDDDAARAGVDGVLDQFLDDRCRPLDHFAGGDLVGQVRRQAWIFPMRGPTSSACAGRTPA